MLLGLSPTLLSILAPALILIIPIFLSQLPAPQSPNPKPSLVDLPASPAKARALTLYPEDTFPNGKYVKLPMGRIRYWVVGPNNGIRVVLITGLAAPAIIFKDLVDRLTKDGFQVLVYDHFGRGHSEAPDTLYNSQLYVTELALLMQHIKWEKARIAGLSMGGGIAAVFASTFPNLVDGKVAFMAPAGLIQDSDIRLSMRLPLSPIFQFFIRTRLFRKLGLAFLAPRPAPPTDSLRQLVELIQLQMFLLPGFAQALASSVKDGPIRGCHRSFMEVEETDISSLVIWGTKDVVAPYKYADELKKLMPRSQFAVIEGAGHDLVMSHPEVVSRALLEFLK